MSELETMFAKFTVAELAAKAGISLTTLLERIGFGATRTRDPALRRATAPIRERYDDDLGPFVAGAKERLAASPVTKKRSAAGKRAHKRAQGPSIGNLASLPERDVFDGAIMYALEGMGKSLKIDEIRVRLPWTNVTRDQLSRAMSRLRDIGKITATGNTKARVYAAVRKPKN